MTSFPPPLAEPTPEQYAEFGRYVAATIGSNETWNPDDDVEAIAEEGSRILGVPLGSRRIAELNLWRTIADDLIIHHDGRCILCQAPETVLDDQRRCVECHAAAEHPIREGATP